MSAHRFTGRLTKPVEGRAGGRSIVVPFDARAAFGEARPPVRGSVNGVPFRSRLMVDAGVTYLGLTNDLRAAAGIEPDADVAVELALDTETREVHVPEALATALESDTLARERFEHLAFTHRREYAEWIEQAKRADTRARRAEKAVAMLRDGKKHP
jgi:hypothetical protein